MNYRAKQDTEAKIKIMQHFVAGGKIQFLKNSMRWEECEDPSWNWEQFHYRIARPSPRMSWEHIKFSYK